MSNIEKKRILFFFSKKILLIFYAQVLLMLGRSFAQVLLMQIWKIFLKIKAMRNNLKKFRKSLISISKLNRNNFYL
tara:strand:- start:37 stop:264 length:228 start_codon:yes stop_codon:yes gene_type:complete